MGLSQVTIRKRDDEDYTFSYYKETDVCDTDIERAQVVRFIDDAVDCVMRKDNHLVTENVCTPGEPLNRVILEAY